MSALSNCVTCGIGAPRVAQMLGRRAADVAPSAARSTSPHFCEVGQRRAARRRDRPPSAAGSGAADAAQDAPRVLLDVLLRDAAGRTGARAPSLMSTPISRARRRTDGDAGAGTRSSRSRAARARRPRGGGSGACRRRHGQRLLARRASFGLALGLAVRVRSLWPWPRPPARPARRGAAAFARRRCRRRAARPTVRMTAPTLTLSPSLTLTSFTTPATEDGTSMVALSVSSSRTG